MHCTYRGLGVALAAVLFSPTLLAAPDTEANKPYQLQVVVRFAKTPDLSKEYQDRVRRELRDSLQAGFGELGHVEILSDHPLLKEIEAKGLQQTLDAWKQVSDVKTHFVLIDYNQGQYELQALQHDGWTGLASPVLRTARTNDRFFVARTAALLIDHDLGLAGTVEPPKPQTDEVNVTLKGGALGVSLGRWVKPDDVLAVARIYQAGADLRSTAVDGTLLQVLAEPNAQGVCRCKLYRRHLNPLGDKALAYRCVKLGTTAAPLQVRVENATTHQPWQGVKVWVAQEGFAVSPREQLLTGPNGYVRTQKPYNHIAFVRLFTTGSSPRAGIPVAILEGRTAVLRLFPDEKADRMGRLEQLRNQLDGQLAESQDVLKAQLSQLKNFKDHAEQRRKATTVLDGLKKEIETRTAEFHQLQKHLEEQKVADARFLQNLELRLDLLRKQEGVLQSFLTDLDAAIKQEADPKRQELVALIGTAKQQMLADDFEQVLDTYQQIIDKASGYDDTLRKEYAEQRKRLLAAWQPKNAAHAQAREYIYGEWGKPKDPAALKEALPRARAEFEICRKNNDSLTPRKLQTINVAHATDLKKREASLQKEDRDDVDLLKLIADDAEQLAQLIKDVNDYLTQAKPAQ